MGRRVRSAIVSSVAVAFSFGCSTLPKEKHPTHSFPKEAMVEPAKRPHKVVGRVKSRVNYPSMQMESRLSQGLCKNYFNKATQNLLKYAKKAGADTVANIRSVVFYFDGKSEELPGAECADDGMEGQILLVGDAIRWIRKDEVRPPTSRGVTRSLAHPRRFIRSKN